MEEKNVVEMTTEEKQAYEAWLSGKTKEPGVFKKARNFVGRHKKALAIAGGLVVAKIAYGKGFQKGKAEAGEAEDEDDCNDLYDEEETEETENE